jgi:hypothetical protein
MHAASCNGYNSINVEGFADEYSVLCRSNLVVEIVNGMQTPPATDKDPRKKKRSDPRSPH